MQPWSAGLRLLEDHGTVTIRWHLEDRVLADRPCQDASLYLAPDPHQVVHSVAVGNVSDVLVDYGAGIEFFGNVVGGGTDDFHASLVSPTVGVRFDEGWKEGVVDVDNLVRVSRDEFGSQDLHVAGEDYQIYPVLVSRPTIADSCWALGSFVTGRW